MQAKDSVRKKWKRRTHSLHTHSHIRPFKVTKNRKKKEFRSYDLVQLPSAPLPLSHHTGCNQQSVWHLSITNFYSNATVKRHQMNTEMTHSSLKKKNISKSRLILEVSLFLMMMVFIYCHGSILYRKKKKKWFRCGINSGATLHSIGGKFIRWQQCIYIGHMIPLSFAAIDRTLVDDVAKSIDWTNKHGNGMCCVCVSFGVFLFTSFFFINWNLKNNIEKWSEWKRRSDRKSGRLENDAVEEEKVKLKNKIKSTTFTKAKRWFVQR